MPAKAIKTPIPRVPLGIHYIGDEEIAALSTLMKNPDKLFRFRYGEKSQCDLLEAELCELTGANHALFVSSGTSALVCCLSGLQIGPGDEVIVPGYTYIATAAAVIDVGAVPVIADIDDSLGLDPADVEKKITPYTKAIIAVHMQGVPCKLSALRTIAKKHDLKLIEDCCQAIGAKYNGVYCGVESDAFAWSTNFYKAISCGEGGVFFTNTRSVFNNGLFQSDPAITMWPTMYTLDSDDRPFARGGYRGNEISAAVLRVQLRRLDGMLDKIRTNARVLRANLKPGAHYTLQHVDDIEGAANFSFGMIVESADAARRLVAEAGEEGLILDSSYTGAFPDRHLYIHWDGILNKNGATPLGYPWKDPSYKGNVQYSKDMCPGVLDLLPRTVKLPINAEMTEQNMLEIADALNKVDARL